MERVDRGDESMFQGFRPEIVEEDISHINLADLNHTHRDDAYKNEAGHIGIQFQKIGQQSDREEADHRPEENLEEAEDIPLRDDPILKYKSPYLYQCLLQIQ